MKEHTAKFDRFIEALRCLCVEHGIMIDCSDYLSIWDIRPDEPPLDYEMIEDNTKATGQ